MSQARSVKVAAGPYRRPRADLYTVLLIVALLALIAGTLALYLETSDYDSPPFKNVPITPVTLQMRPAPSAAPLGYSSCMFS